MCDMNDAEDRIGVLVAIVLGVVIPLAVALTLLWVGADRGQIEHGSASVAGEKTFVSHQQK